MTNTNPFGRRSKPLAWVLAGACTLAALAFVVPALAAPATTAVSQAPRPTSTLDRIISADRITLGYRPDAAPMSYRAESGKPEGYSIAVCNRVADALKRTLGRPSLAVEWVPVSNGFTDLADGRVDLICGADEITLANRAHASFSIPIFPGGVSALVRANSDAAFRDALEERPKPYAPLWRGTPPKSLQHRTYSALVGSDTMEAVKVHIAELHLQANVKPVADYDAGIAAVLDRGSDVLFGDREKLLEAVRRNPAGRNLLVLSRRFTFALVALATPRNDDDFRLAVDRALSEVYAVPAFGTLFTDNFGVPDTDTVAFFRNVGVPTAAPIREPR
ncbi:MAG: transporter substrate-binding domain-containing protein [Vicinamibacterales bacterium]|nr:transporter substrate-binding domain-containing protein [Vicinamibacterales bacterium]